MRTTLKIDDDILAAAKDLAHTKRLSVGQVISGLARQALTPSSPPAAYRNGILLLPRRADGTPITLEVVNRLRDELP